MVLSIDFNLLAGFYQARSGALGGAGVAGGTTASRKVAPTAPWTRPQSQAEAGQAVKDALSGRRLINENAAQLDLPGASADYRKLFALYQGLSTLEGVVNEMSRRGLTSFDRGRVENAFARGLAEIESYVKTAELEKIRLVQGEAASTAKTTVPVSRDKTEYITPVLVTGTSSDPVQAFQGDVKFTISIKRVATIHNVAVDLAGMGAQTRSMGNVITYINQQLEAAGVDTRLATHRIPGAPRTTTVGGKTITLGQGADQWALKVKVSTGETVSFAAQATAGAVYMAQAAGDPDPDGKASTDDGVVQQQLLKFQTDTATVPAPPQQDGESYWVDGRLYARTLGPEVEAVRATKVGADGSVYMLADVTAKIDGQAIKGERDVALLKYDSAGKLIYARTLGASEEASGLALGLAADGKVAVAGTLKGALLGATEGPMNSGATGAFADYGDSFVTVFDDEGQELWTQRRGARQGDEATEVAFGADGTVYVAGRAQSGMPGATAVGGWDSYLQAIDPDLDAEGRVQTLFTESFGTAGSDRPAGMVVDGTSVVVASVDDGRAVLRRYDVSGAAPVLTATRDLGDLQGGAIAGLALDGGEVVVVGSTANASLSAGTVTRAHAGGVDAFAARISANLGAGGSIAYYGGGGDDRASSLAVSGGQVWIAGAAGTDLPGHATAVGEKDGFLARLDVAAGTVDWSRRFSGKDGHAAPGSIAVDSTGASVLDRLGLPKGELQLARSPRLTASSSLRAGDQFTVRVGSGRTATVTLAEEDTLDTLATKIRRATGFQAKVTIGTSDGLRKLTIAPISDRVTIEFGPGKTDRNALEMLGIPEGVVRNTEVVDGKTVPADGKGMLYGLGLPSDLNLRDDAQRRHALAEINGAMGVIRQAYKDLVAAASPRSAQAQAAVTGKAPAYITNQIANYQAALARLTGGG